MKKALIAAIIGLAGSLTASFGQANYFFNSYIGDSYSPVQWSPGVPVQPAHQVSCTLSWSYGTTTGELGYWVPTSGDIPGWGPGWILGSNFSTAANYQGGPISFTITARSPFYGGDLAHWTWTEPGTVPNGPPIFFTQMPDLVIAPEPTSIGLLLLGAAVWRVWRRK